MCDSGKAFVRNTDLIALSNNKHYLQGFDFYLRFEIKHWKRNTFYTPYTLSIMKLLYLLLLTFLFSTPSITIASDYRKLFAEADPSVVVLYTIERQVDPRQKSGEISRRGLGSGFVVDMDGHIITAAHVVQTADAVQVEFVDGTKVTAHVIASNTVKDVALLALDEIPTNLKPVKISDSDDMRVGDEVFVIGAPYGLSHTLSIGHISSRHKNSHALIGNIQAETFQTDAAINQGNSGGPMFNHNGEVVGVVSYIRSKSGGSVGLGFAITSNEAVKALFTQHMTWSGMSGIALTGPLAKALNIPQTWGYLVQKVALNSPAARLGVKASRLPIVIEGKKLFIGGDIILSIEGIEMSPDTAELFLEKAKHIESGTEITVTVLRAGEKIELKAPFEKQKCKHCQLIPSKLQ